MTPLVVRTSSKERGAAQSTFQVTLTTRKISVFLFFMQKILKCSNVISSDAVVRVQRHFIGFLLQIGSYLFIYLFILLFIYLSIYSSI